MTYITVTEAAQRLGVSRARVHQLIDDNKLPSMAAMHGARRIRLVPEAAVNDRTRNLPGADPGYLTINDAAAAVDRSPETLRKWIKQGRLPAVKQYGLWMVSRTDLNTINPPRRGRPRKDQP